MECIRGMLSSFLSTRREKSERSMLFVENGRCSIPIRDFSAEELIRATNNFDRQHVVHEDAFYSLYKSCFGKRPILVKKFKREIDCFSGVGACGVRDLVISSQMSNHKNVLKLIGFCLEFENPALVYEDGKSVELLARSLYGKRGDVVQNASLSWGNRLSIANDIACVVVYLHTAFSTPIVHRNLKLQEVIIDRCGVAKLFDFSLSIAIPHGESEVEDAVVGTCSFLEPQYMKTGILTEKTDVYQFGMILLQLLTGESSMVCARDGNYTSLDDHVKDYVDGGQVNEIVDIRIQEGGGIEKEQQLQDFVALALRCIQEEREYRPGMIEVAKELKRIQGLVRPPLA